MALGVVTSGRLVGSANALCTKGNYNVTSLGTVVVNVVVVVTVVGWVGDESADHEVDSCLGFAVCDSKWACNAKLVRLCIGTIGSSTSGGTDTRAVSSPNCNTSCIRKYGKIDVVVMCKVSDPRLTDHLKFDGKSLPDWSINAVPLPINYEED